MRFPISRLIISQSIPAALLFLLLPVIPCQSQGYVTLGNADKKALNFYNKARAHVEQREAREALEVLEKALETEPGFIDAFMMKAELLYGLGETQGAIDALSSAVRLDSTYHPRSLYSLSRLYEKGANFDASAKCLRWYVAHADISDQEKAQLRERLTDLSFKAELMANPVAYAPEPVPGAVNTEDNESLPAFTVDGRQMIFTRMAGGQEDLYVSDWDSTNMQWGYPVPLRAINTQFNEGGETISADGKVLAFTSCGRRDGVGGCDIYVALLRPDGTWSRVRNVSEINSRGWDGHPTLTADGRAMYFSSDRSGGVGGRDIWLTRRNATDRWSTPVNIGAVVNTKGHEAAPFLHFDDRTLYFMSTGHRGLGDFDLFVTRRTASGWEVPENLGYPINSPSREGALSIHPDGIHAYYTGDQLTRTRRHADIFTFELDPSLRPAPVSYLHGFVTDARTGIPVESAVEIFNLNDTSEVFHYRSSAQGEFKAALAHGAQYGMHVNAGGYAFYSEQFALDIAEPFSTVTKTIALQPIHVNPEGGTTASTPIVLHNIQFETGSAQLRTTSIRELEALRDLLLQYPDLRIEIRGHTDDVGSVEDNMLLSEARAKAVYTWLTEAGIGEDRLQFAGFGEMSPVAPNDTDAGRALNRRTEFVIL